MGKIRIELTEAEAEALRACADEGFEGLANDGAASKAYLGGQRGVDAASRALDKLAQAINGGAVIDRKSGLTFAEIEAIAKVACGADAAAMFEDAGDEIARKAYYRGIEKLGLHPST